MIKLIWDKRFKRNLKKYISKHPEMEDKIVVCLVLIKASNSRSVSEHNAHKKDKLKLFTENPYAPELRNHNLSGQLKDLRAIVIDYDCRIVFRFVEKNSVLLISIGTHDEVY